MMRLLELGHFRRQLGNQRVANLESAVRTETRHQLGRVPGPIAEHMQLQSEGGALSQRGINLH